jgi:alpha-L-rhamnosidase
LFDGPLLDGEGERSAYSSGPQRGPDGRFHLLWMWRETPDAMTNHTLSYARSRDLIHWETSSGNLCAYLWIPLDSRFICRLIIKTLRLYLRRFEPVNTVINAFHIRSLQMMAELVKAAGKGSEAAGYKAMASKAHSAFQKHLFLPATSAYRDGEGTDHTSQHASLFPLAFGLVPDEQTQAVVEFVQQRGMACSVYAAQYLMEGPFSHGGAHRALELIIAPTDRSWRHMVESGAKISWEAWDMKYKPNQDWNHAWRAAPANLLPRYVLGAEALEPGWKQARIRPHPGTLTHAKGKIPTPLGPIEVGWENKTSFQMRLEIPSGMTAMLELPASPVSKGISITGTAVAAKRVGSHWIVNENVSGTVSVVVE